MAKIRNKTIVATATPDELHALKDAAWQRRMSQSALVRQVLQQAGILPEPCRASAAQ